MWYLYEKNKGGKNFKEVSFTKSTNHLNQNVVSWTDTANSTCEFFTLERSEDGIYYEIMDTIPLQKPSAYQKYDETKSTVAPKDIQYKLKAWSPINLWKEIENMDMSWYILAFILSLISNYSRAVRWQTIIEPLGYKPDTMNTFLSVNIMYFSNLVIPRSGEISRCSILYKYEKVPVAKLVGTVLVERVIDMIALAILTGLLVLSQLDFMKTYFNRPDVQESLKEKAHLWPYLIAAGIIGIIVVIALYLLRNRILATKIGNKIGKLLFDLWQGVKSTKNIKRKWAFFIHSILIWTMYFGVLYVSFKSYESTQNLSPVIAFAALIMGSVGMIIPTAGGIGTWNVLVTFTLVVYGVSEPNAFIYSFIALFMMTITNVIAGGLSFIYLPIYNRKRKLQQPQN